MELRHVGLVVAALLMALFGVPCGLIFLLTAAPSPLPGPGPGTALRAPLGASVPAAVLAADQQASAGAPAGCRVPVSVLLGIGEVESGNAAGRAIGPGGVVDPPVIGPALDGSLPGTAIVADSDGGALDGDPAWDHAVGFLQILPSTWRRWAAPGADPQNVGDAARTAVTILCQLPRDLADQAALSATLHAYNDSDAYVATVEHWVVLYATYDVETAPASAAVTQPTSS